MIKQMFGCAGEFYMHHLRTVLLISQRTKFKNMELHGYFIFSNTYCIMYVAKIVDYCIFVYTELGVTSNFVTKLCNILLTKVTKLCHITKETN